MIVLLDASPLSMITYRYLVLFAYARAWWEIDWQLVSLTRHFSRRLGQASGSVNCRRPERTAPKLGGGAEAPALRGFALPASV